MNMIQKRITVCDIPIEITVNNQLEFDHESNSLVVQNRMRLWIPASAIIKMYPDSQCYIDVNIAENIDMTLYTHSDPHIFVSPNNFVSD